MRAFLILSLLLSVAACGDDDSAADAGVDSAALGDAGLDAAADAGATSDAETMRDSGTVPDMSAADSGQVDGATADMSVEPDVGPADAGPDAPMMDAGDDMAVFDAGTGACNDLEFGQPAVTLRRVDSLPAMTGGDIALGIYDLVDVRVTSGLSATFQATWSFGPDAIAMINQITVTAPGPINPYVDEYHAAGTTLSRRRTCGGSGEFEGGYTARRTDAGAELDLISGELLLTFRRR